MGAFDLQRIAIPNGQGVASVTALAIDAAAPQKPSDRTHLGSFWQVGGPVQAAVPRFRVAIAQGDDQATGDGFRRLMDVWL